MRRWMFTYRGEDPSEQRPMLDAPGPCPSGTGGVELCLSLLNEDDLRWTAEAVLGDKVRGIA